MKRVFCALLASLLLTSCSKELSEENGIPNTNPPLGENCQVNEVADVDSASSQKTFSRIVQFNQAGAATSTYFFDNQTNTKFDEILISYRGDTMRVGPTDYFLLDANKRVKSFFFLIGPDTAATRIEVRYSYDGAGYLSRRDEFINGATLPQYWYTYIWRNGDLVELEGFYRSPLGIVPRLSASMQYDQSVTVKGNLIYIQEEFEVTKFLSALNFGPTPQHLLTRTSVTNFDPVNQSPETGVDRFRSHMISSDGYIQAYTIYREKTRTEPADSFRVGVGYFCK